MAHQWTVTFMCLYCCILGTGVLSQIPRPLRCEIALNQLLLYPSELYSSYVSQFLPYTDRTDINCCDPQTARGLCCISTDATTGVQKCKCAKTIACGKTPTVPIVPTGNCPAGWALYQATQICIKVQTTALTFAAAQTACATAATGGKLFEIRDVRMQTFLQGQLASTGTTTSLWLGLKRAANAAVLTDITYASATGGRLPDAMLSLFAAGGIGTTSATDSCVDVEPQNGFSWRLDPCTQAMGYVCEVPATTSG